ncbi:MAG: hypothetical protein JRN59_05640 [Nitrososphaerota archaeon]|nr:hypothetical protein [Nitrososphaerota archaeon]
MDTTIVFAELTWKLIILILMFVAIGGAMSYSFALERGQVAQQFLSLRVSRAKYVLLKWTSVFVVFAVFALIFDFIAFFLYLGYFPNLGAYTIWGEGPSFAFLFMVGEQLVLLAFLNSLVMAISFGLRRTTISLLTFLVFTLLSAGYFPLGSATIPDFLRLGYGDYLFANGLSTYTFELLYRPASQALASAPTTTDYLVLIYRAVGAVVLSLVSVVLFVRADLD